MTSTQAVVGNRSESFAMKVKAETEKAINPKKKLLRNIGVLLFTLFIFASLGLFTSSLSGIIIFIIVILVHETGHFIGMKLFGYRDVEMFFIPFIGAAVSGIESNPSSVRKAIVALLGPIPGILIGIICAILFFKSDQSIFAVSASTFLFINGFNLLPFHPLDGGRFFEYLLFSKNPKIEITFKIITCLLLAGLAYILKSPVIGLLVVFVVFSLRAIFISSKAAHELKKIISLEELSQKNMPDFHFANVISQLKKKLIFHNDNAKLVAKYILDIWNRVCTKPATTGATLGLITIYVTFLVTGVLSPFIFEAAKVFKDTKTEIVYNLNENDEYIQTEIKYYRGKKIFEVPVNKNGFYHGVQTGWHLQSDHKSQEGTWKDGYWHGEWKYWNQEGNIESIIEYEKGKAVRYTVLKSGDPVDLPQDQWPYAIKNSTQSGQQGLNKNQ